MEPRFVMSVKSLDTSAELCLWRKLNFHGTLDKLVAVDCQRKAGIVRQSGKMMVTRWSKTLFLLLGLTSAVAYGEQASPPNSLPRISTETQEWSLDQGGPEGEWSPLLSRKEHLFLPVLRGPMERVKRGDPGSFEELIRMTYSLVA